MYYRNGTIRSEVKEFSQTNKTCQLLGSIERMEKIEQENLFFVIFQIFQLLFCLDAVSRNYNDN